MNLPDNSSILVLASNYNPSIVSKEWLYKKKISIGDVSNFVHTPVFSMVENEKFSLVVDERRLQIVVKQINEENIGLAYKIVGQLAAALPETPYKALALNFNYITPKEKCDLGRIFVTDKDKITNLFSNRYELGTVVIFEYQKFIVNFSVVPSLVQNKVRLVFNFRSEVTDTNEIEDRLIMQDVVLKKAEDIVKRMCK